MDIKKLLNGNQSQKSESVDGNSECTMNLFRVILIMVMALTISSATTDIKVGVILGRDINAPYDAERCAAAIDLAIEEINTNLLNESYRLVPIVKTIETGCDATKAPGYAADLVFKDNIAALIGPACTHTLEPVARLADYWDLPILTGLGESGRFRYKSNFMTLSRYSYCQCLMTGLFKSILVYYNWTDVTVLVDLDDEYSSVLGASIDFGLRERNYLPHVVNYYGKSDTDYEDILREASEVSRVIVICASGDGVREILIKAHQIGYPQTGEYVFIDVELFSFPGPYWGNHSWQRGDEYDAIAREAFESLLRISLYRPEGTLYDEFAEKVKIRSLTLNGFDYDGRNEQVNFFVASFYDAVVHYGQALNRSLDMGFPIRSGREFSVKFLWNTTFHGATGKVSLDEIGDRKTQFAIQDMDPKTGSFKAVAYSWGPHQGYTPIEGEIIYWGGDRDSPPLNQPRCWFRGDNPDCRESEPISPLTIAMIALVSILGIGSIASFLFYREHKKYMMLKDLSWIISKEELIRHKTACSSSFSQLSMGSAKTLEQVYGDVALYRQYRVSLRMCANRNVAQTKDLLKEVHKRRNLQHNNLVRFVGAVLETETILVYEYCQKGSLQDILLNDSIKLDDDFKRSLIGDIVAGMKFIHSSDIQCHGRLRSTNCVVDGRFILKLTDFGLPSFYNNEMEEKNNIHYQKLLWQAPELLRDESLAQRGTAKGDVYSFAIILQEIVTSSVPYEHAREHDDVRDILAKIATHSANPFRPEIPCDACQPLLLQLIEECWQEDPASRPTFDKIQIQLKLIHRNTSSNLMDNLLRRMEQYANNLEQLVAERTQQLLHEQRKTEQLLLQILPKSIAEQLKKGMNVEPEAFDCVTIYFSDIVGFTAISAASSPIQVVQLLNDLYTDFDATLENFDVYKVETIGDAYMVVSGLPICNGDKHAGEIAAMSQALLSSILKFRIRHMPEHRLGLRIGLNSGPCVAGVVGLKMPRYCLFGDTVNTASRMESNGLSLRIHVSESTAEILRETGGFKIIPRGMFDIKIARANQRLKVLLELTQNCE